jgi:hypothetical protein
LALQRLKQLRAAKEEDKAWRLFQAEMKVRRERMEEEETAAREQPGEEEHGQELVPTADGEFVAPPPALTANAAATAASSSFSISSSTVAPNSVLHSFSRAQAVQSARLLGEMEDYQTQFWFELNTRLVERGGLVTTGSSGFLRASDLSTQHGELTPAGIAATALIAASDEIAEFRLVSDQAYMERYNANYKAIMAQLATMPDTSSQHTISLLDPSTSALNAIVLAYSTTQSAQQQQLLLQQQQQQQLALQQQVKQAVPLPVQPRQKKTKEAAT